MKQSILAMLAAAGLAGAARADISFDFEPPAYVAGPFLNGQQGWAGGGGSYVDNTRAAHGSQSMRCVWPTAASGSGSHATGGNSNMWWSASVNLYINSAATDPQSFASISLGTGLGTTWYFGVFGDGRIEDFNGANPVHDNLGPGALNQWLSISAVGYNPTGDINVRVQGLGIDRSYHANFGVQTVRQDLVTLGVNNQNWSGAYPLDVFFDDLTVSTTPAPGGAAAIVLGGTLVCGRRRRR